VLPFNYEFPEPLQTLDDNWLAVRILAVDGDQQWSAAQATLLPHELQELAEWMEGLADGCLSMPSHPWEELIWCATENELLFKVVGTGDPIRLQARVYADPPHPAQRANYISIDLEPSRETLRSFAAAVRAEAESWPYRFR
jgi:hypothetical protein